MCLTAGTALSRFYFRHRFSSDLDFVVFGPGRFDDVADFALALLRHDFPVGGVDVRVRERGLLTVFVREKETALKIDIMAREPIPEPVPPRSEGGILVDHPENIFVDKICALADRALAKDVVDLFFLVREGGLDIRAGIGRARRRRPHVHPTTVAMILDRFDYEAIPGEVVWWEKPTPEDEIRAFMRDLSDDILGLAR